MTDKNNDSSITPSIFPELLSLDDLKTHIEKRFPKHRNLNKLTREEAIKVYRSMIMPLPQRQYRNNSRGRLLTERRIKAELEAKPLPTLSFNTLDTPLPKRPSTDRLKPPPDSSSSTKIRLSSSANDSKSSIAIKNIVINKRTDHPEVTSTSNVRSSKRSEPPTSLNSTESNTTKPKRVKITWP